MKRNVCEINCKLAAIVLMSVMSMVPGSNGNRPNLTPEELLTIASLNLCPHFQGECGTGCQRYIKHRWGLPLCDQNRKCCIPDDAYQGAQEHRELTTISTTTTTHPPPTTTTTTTTTANQADTHFAGPNVDACGQMEWARRRKRIVGGSLSPPGAWPWLLALRSLVGAHACSGALVAQRWVVTAAHCFRQFVNPSMWRMRVGERDLLVDDGTERDIAIDNIIIYPEYESRSGRGDNATIYARYKHDLALIHLSEDANVEPICLPAGDAAEPEVQNSSDDSNMTSRFRKTRLEKEGDCWVSGWGFTRDQTNQDQVLRQVQGDLVDSETCSEMWGTRLDRDMICFGDGTRGPCAGDSGGPLSCRMEGRWYLSGVVSWGTEDCNVSGYPSVFTRLAPYMSWLHATMQQRQP